MTAKNLLEIPHVGAQQCGLECGKQALYQAVFCTELKLAVTYGAKETVESGVKVLGSHKEPALDTIGLAWNTAQRAPIPLFL